MSNRQARRAKRRNNDLAEGLAAIALLAALVDRKPSSDAPPQDRGIWLAHRLVADARDERAQNEAIELAAGACDAEDLAGMFAVALKYVAGGYLPMLLDRTDELEAGHSDTTRQAVTEQARDSIAQLIEKENSK